MLIRGSVRGLTVLAESRHAVVIQQALERTLGVKASVLPAKPSSLSFAGGDFLVLAIAGGEDAAALGKVLRLKSLTNKLPAGGFQITAKDGATRIASVTGGDLAGLLYAIPHLKRVGKLTPDGLELPDKQIVEKPAFRYRIYWTWDHSTNWYLDSPGLVDWGCNNEYLKPSHVFVEDYKRLIDHMLVSRANATLIWGFLRDAHGGVAAGQELVSYANARGLKLMPSIGTSCYGGFYYRGQHPFSADAWLRKRPDCRATNRNGEFENRLCPTHPDNIRWLKDGTRWLLETFDTDAINLEYGDFVVCHCTRCKAKRASMGGTDFDYYKEMALSQNPVIDEALDIHPDAWVMYATYTGFQLQPKDAVGYSAAGASSKRPDFLKRISPKSICMWTLTGMLNQEPVPIVKWLEDGRAKALLSSANWPAGLECPTERSCGFVHQGSQWYAFPNRPGHTRYTQIISTIKEAAIRGLEAGLHGLCIHGEIPTQCVPYELNYLAFSHFCYHPHDNARQFARAQLSDLLGGEEQAEFFIETLAHAETGTLDEQRRKKLVEIERSYASRVRQGSDFETYRRWRWLGFVAGTNQGAPYLHAP